MCENMGNVRQANCVLGSCAQVGVYVCQGVAILQQRGRRASV